jgi:hypothetical protein
MYTSQTNGLGADMGAGTINPAALNSTRKRTHLHPVDLLGLSPVNYGDIVSFCFDCHMFISAQHC